MRKARIFYARVDEFWRKEEKYTYLDQIQDRASVEWQEVHPDSNHNWLTSGMQDEFGTFIHTGTKEAKANSNLNDSIFRNYGRGVATTRDAWTYNFDNDLLAINIKRFIEHFNHQLDTWVRLPRQQKNIDAFVNNDNRHLSWSEGLKNSLRREIRATFEESHLRVSLYRPFTRKHLYFDATLNERRYQIPVTFPTEKISLENISICISDRGQRSPFSVLTTNMIPDLHLCATSDLFQCFPFYTYDEDGTNRVENITDWAFDQFRVHYKDTSITKWNIFHYVYAVLHHPHYRECYAADLKKALPRIPFAPDFHSFADIGKQLAEIHVNYEQQLEYPLERIENPRSPLDWRVEKMKLSKDKCSLIYNDFLTLSGIPPEVFDYRLGNRSALDWIIDQYQVSMDKRSGITNDPNREDDPEYIVRLIGQVITVSLETNRLVDQLNGLRLTA